MLSVAKPTRPAIAAGWRTPTAFSLLSAIAFVLSWASPTLAVTPDSPEVRQLIEKGLKYLETAEEERLGGKCIIGLAFFKDNRKDHSRVKLAVEACETGVALASYESYNYSKALALIFLCEYDARLHKSLIGQYASLLAAHQKPHGGFAYTTSTKGDTSQTQYAALAYWELMKHNVSRPSVATVERCANWLLRTQDPSGVWAYIGADPGDFELIEQSYQPSPCMLAAGLSSVMICGNMLGQLKAGDAGEKVDDEVPDELQPVKKPASVDITPLSGTGSVKQERLLAAMKIGREWMDKNFTINNGGYYSCYYLYSLERYKSFEEHITGDAPLEPDWYNKGYEFLKATQRPDGSWKMDGKSGPGCSTAFAVLFLLRSTKQSLQPLGEGTLIGGKALPSDLSKVDFSKSGKLVVRQKPTSVDKMLGMLGGDDAEALEALISNPNALVVQNVSPKESRRLEQVVRTGEPGARILAVRALSKLRALDYAPTLIYALTDPDPRVVREARAGLRSVSRRFSGYGVPDNPLAKGNEQQLFNGIQGWKTWYAKARPDAPPLP